jgi:hypothetical protein
MLSMGIIENEYSEVGTELHGADGGVGRGRRRILEADCGTPQLNSIGAWWRRSASAKARGRRVSPESMPTLARRVLESAASDTDALSRVPGGGLIKVRRTG